MKKSHRFIVIFNVLLFSSLFVFYSCKTADGIKVVGDGKTDSDLSQKVQVTRVSLTVPLSSLSLEDEEYNVNIGGYSTAIVALGSDPVSNVECTIRPETEEIFTSDYGKLSDIYLNSSCKAGYQISVNLYCKIRSHSSRMKCYSGDIEIPYSQLKTTSKLNLSLDLHKELVSIEGPDTISVPGELSSETIEVELEPTLSAPKRESTQDVDS